MSVQAMGWVLEQPVAPGPKLVLVSIANHSDRLGSGCFIDQANIAIESTMSERTVRRHIEALEEQGLLVRYRRGRRDGTGRSSDGYEIPGVRGQTADECAAELAAAGRSVIEPKSGRRGAHTPPVDNPAQPANLSGSAPEPSGGSTGQLRQLNRPTSTAQPDTGVRGAGSSRTEPREEEARADILRAVLDRLPEPDRHRLQFDHGYDALRGATIALQQAGWPVQAATTALLANPLHDRRGQPVDSVARVLRSRAERLVAVDPPEPSPSRPRADCHACQGTGWTTATGAAITVAPCPCREAA